MDPNLLVIAGPTASGKTRLGVQLATALDGEILSADSRQVFRGMDIGTGKDLHEYGDIPYHLIDIVEAGSEFNVFEFQRRFIKSFEEVQKRKRLPILVGGTGLYLDSVLMGYRLEEVPENPALRSELEACSLAELELRLRMVVPRLHNTTDICDRARLVRALEIAVHESVIPRQPWPRISPVVFGIRWERKELRERITRRLKERLQNGMIEEVARLHRSGVPFETLEFYGLEYRFIARFLKGELNRNDMFQKLNSAIHDFAKRQETWFRRMERNGTRFFWLQGAGNPFEEALNLWNKAAAREH
jgi:tRNA dimethylallyltransferase